VPVIVMVSVPAFTVEPTWICTATEPDPGAGSELGLIVTWTPVPCPEAVKLTAELNPPETVLVTFTCPLPPGAMVMLLGEALRLKLPVVVTVSVTEVVAVIEPEVPVTVIGYVPGTVEEPTVIVMVDVPAPVIEVGLKPTVTPVGWPLAERVMTPLNPPLTALVMVEVLDPPCAMENVLGLAERLKPGLGGPVRSLIRFWPCGLPMPHDRS